MNDIRDEIALSITDAIIKLASPSNISACTRPCKLNINSFYIELVYDNYHVEEKFNIEPAQDMDTMNIASGMLGWLFSDYFKAKALSLK